MASQPDTILGKCATRHAATECWLSTAAIFLQPSIRRNLICPLTTRLKSKRRRHLRSATSPASSRGGRAVLVRVVGFG